jgi:Ca2+-binding RTX toxin-like protein
MATIIGTDSSETLHGTAFDDHIQGRGGNDILYGKGGNDRLDGGAGNDWLFGGFGNDILIGGLGFNDLWGDSGADIFTMSARSSAGFSDDLVWDFRFDIDQVDLRAWGVSDFGQVLALLERDSYGDATLNAYYAGHDHVLTLNAVAPRDLIAADFIFANPAAITATGTALDDVMFGSRLNDVLSGGAGFDILLGGLGNDILNGNAGNDRLVGGDGNDRLDGGTESDLLEGEAGADALFGGAGRDFLEGGAGNDQLRGGAGTDDLNGGLGADRFIFDDGEFGGTTRTTADYIADFFRFEGDKIDVSLADARPGGLDDAFAFIGTAAFSGVAGQLRTFQSSGDTFVAGDLNGDRAADFLIMVEGQHTLVATDFVL